MKERLKTLFRTKTRDEWCKIMEGSDICFAPVLSMGGSAAAPDMKHRGTFVEENGVTQPGPAPRFSRTPSKIQRPPARPGEHTEEALRDWGFANTDLDQAPQSRRDPKADSVCAHGLSVKSKMVCSWVRKRCERFRSMNFDSSSIYALPIF